MKKLDEAPDTREKLRWWLKWGGPAPDRKSATNCSVTIDNLTPVEHDATIAFVNGTSMLKVVKGRLHACHTYDPLPEPVDDPIVAPHWAKFKGEPVKYGNYPKDNAWHSPSIIIGALGAGIGSRHFDNADTVKRNIEAVLSCGFVCLRSKRFTEGTYDELWVLHSLYGAKGPLKKFLDQQPDKQHWHACTFLARDMDIRFGTMDITIQRWALCNPD